MAENESFFRKVVRFVANPATDWTDLSSRTDDSKELELEKSELKAMIERKRRNDFVRKREFDMLRRVRREGLSGDQLAALGTSSRMDDSEVRPVDSPPSSSTGVKAKIDAIEQQMVGEPGFGNPRPSSAPPPARATAARDSGRVSLRDPLSSMSLPPLPPARSVPFSPSGPGSTLGFNDESERLPRWGGNGSGRQGQADANGAMGRGPAASSTAPAQMGKGLPPLAPMSAVSFSTGAGGGLSTKIEGHVQGGDSAVEVSEVVHDPELDEAVIAFANADFVGCEEALQRITGKDGPRINHAETWLVLFDLYRATGQQQRFESLALDYAQRFGWSAPQWYSLPHLVAEAAAADDRPITSRLSSDRSTEVGWVCPERLDIEAVARLRSQTLQMPMPWVFDWAGLKTVDAEAAMQLATLFRLWSGQTLDMRWNSGEQLFSVLQDAAPTGMRDADPVFWLTRMDALRLVNRPDQFDETAIDYCVTYEVSPPSWEAARCKVVINDDGRASRMPSESPVSELPAGFMESGLAEDAATGIEIAMVELSGQLVGDISLTLAHMQDSLGDARVVNVSCLRLIRVDFIAAGDLLNWVLSRRQESRVVHLVNAHRLIALFFGAMGINEHAKVQVHKN